MASLNPNDLEIMRVLWDHGPLKPAAIQEHLPQPIKNSALRWQLAALVDKGHVKRRKEGKAYHYQAITPRHSALKKLTRRLADVFCGGSAAALIGRMIESQDRLSDDDIRELQRIAGRKALSRKTPRKKGADT